MTRLRTLLIALVVAAIVAVGAGLAANRSGKATTTAASSIPVAAALQNAFRTVYAKVSPSVVQIETSEGLGSGIVFDGKGDIVTNAHVVGTAKTFKVTTSTGKILTGSLVGTFVEDDLAVIKVPGTGLQPATFANSDQLQIGDIAMAIGNPLGLSSSFTQGIVSALNRQEPEGNGVILQDALQTSAAINPGNSGGALVDIRGRVIGIPTLGAADPQMGGAAAGIGFAIPSNTVTSIAGQLVKNGKVIDSNRAYLGVRIGNTGEETGVYVTQTVPGAPAEKAGLKAGDVITSLNGTKTPDSSALGTVLAGLKPGQIVKIGVTHQNGSTDTVSLTLGTFSS